MMHPNGTLNCISNDLSFYLLMYATCICQHFSPLQTTNVQMCLGIPAFGCMKFTDLIDGGVGKYELGEDNSYGRISIFEIIGINSQMIGIVDVQLFER